ncbi:unnamed protein product, partial [Thlaspi arvense]
PEHNNEWENHLPTRLFATDRFPKAWFNVYSKSNHLLSIHNIELLQFGTITDSGRILRLALIVIVDGVIIATAQHPRPTPKYVSMLVDLDYFLNFPWGRKRVAGKSEDPIGTLCEKLKTGSMRLQGFPLILQFLAFKCIPSLKSLLKLSDEMPTLMQTLGEELPKQPPIQMDDIIRVENNPKLVVTSTLSLEALVDDGWGDWDDESKDAKVKYMVDRIDDGEKFAKSDWPGGDSSLPLLVVKPVKPVGFTKHVSARRPNKGKLAKITPPASSTKNPTARRLKNTQLYINAITP